MADAHILMVEDEPEIAAVLRDYLAPHATVHCLDSGAQASAWVRANKPDLVILDLMLPDKDGLEVCREIRAFSAVPIVMLTAKTDEIDRLLGLELGADDYVCKPFYPREVVARVKRLLRRPASGDTAPDSALIIDEARFEALLDGHKLDLTPVEFRLLAALAQHPGLVYSRDRLMNRMYADGRVVSDRTIDTHVRNLRTKLQSVRPGTEGIESVYGVGYRCLL